MREKLRLTGGSNRSIWKSFASQTANKGALYSIEAHVAAAESRGTTAILSGCIVRISKLRQRNDEDAPSQGASFNRLSTLQRVAKSPFLELANFKRRLVPIHVRYKLSHRFNRTRKFKSPCWVANLAISGNRTRAEFF